MRPEHVVCAVVVPALLARVQSRQGTLSLPALVSQHIFTNPPRHTDVTVPEQTGWALAARGVDARTRRPLRVARACAVVSVFVPNLTASALYVKTMLRQTYVP